MRDSDINRHVTDWTAYLKKSVSMPLQRATGEDRVRMATAMRKAAIDTMNELVAEETAAAAEAAKQQEQKQTDEQPPKQPRRRKVRG